MVKWTSTVRRERTRSPEIGTFWPQRASIEVGYEKWNFAIGTGGRAHVRTGIRHSHSASRSACSSTWGRSGRCRIAGLLDLFARGGEPSEAAFATLVERHGPMVLRVCRHVLADGHLAEDAFQVTFLLLARRRARSMTPMRWQAGSIAWHGGSRFVPGGHPPAHGS